MPLNIILKCGYDRKFSPEECRKDDASYVVSKLTESYYKNFIDGRKDYEASLKSAKYIMEYLYLVKGKLVGNHGYCTADVRHSPYEGYRANIRFIFDMDIVVIDRIASTMFYTKRTEFVVYADGMLSDDFFRWAETTELNGTIHLHFKPEFTELCYRNELIEEYGPDPYKDFMALDSESESEEYYYYECYLDHKKETKHSAAHIRRCADGSIEFTRIPWAGHSPETETFDVVSEYIKKRPAEESVTLVYWQENIAQRLIYNDRSRFLTGYIYSHGKITEVEKHEAFECFHKLYREMCEQNAENEKGE